MFIHSDIFRLIVVAEKDVVYQRFPIPLINRLEKHLLVMSTHLTKEQEDLVKNLQGWVETFSAAKQEGREDRYVFSAHDRGHKAIVR